MSVILSIDAPTKSISVAVIKNNKLSFELTLNDPPTHSRVLMPIISDAIKYSCIDVSDVDLFLISSGPGSFTGLRIVFASLKGILHATKKKVIAISTLKSMSYCTSDLVCTMMDARANRVYGAIYVNNKEIVKEDVYYADDLLSKIPKEKCLFVGDGAFLYKEKIEDMFKNNASFCTKTTDANRLYNAYIAGEGKEFDYTSLKPNYLRKPKAEQELEITKK